MPDGTKVNPKYLEAYKERNPNAVEGKDYFLEGKTYNKPSNNTTTKPTSSGVASSTTSTTKEDDESTPFRGMLVESAAAKAKEENKSAVNKGTNSSLDRMVSLANNNKTLYRNYNPNQFLPGGGSSDYEMFKGFKPEIATQEIMMEPDEVVETGEDGQLNTQSVMDHLNLKRSLKKQSGQWSEGDETEYQKKKEKLTKLFDATKENPNLMLRDGNNFLGSVTSPSKEDLDYQNYKNSQQQMYKNVGGITTGGFNVANAFSKDVTGTGLLGVAEEGARWAPYTGEVMDFKEMISDFGKGNYGDAAISALATGVPILPAKYTKKLVKSAGNILGFGRNSARVAKIANQAKKFEKSLNQFSPGGKIDEMLKASGRRAPSLAGKIKSGGSKVKKYKKKLDKTVETFSGSEDQDKNIAIKKSGDTKPTG